MRDPRLPSALLLDTIDGHLVDRFDDDADTSALEAGNGLIQLDEFAMNDSRRAPRVAARVSLLAASYLPHRRTAT